MPFHWMRRSRTSWGTCSSINRNDLAPLSRGLSPQGHVASLSYRQGGFLKPTNESAIPNPQPRAVRRLACLASVLPDIGRGDSGAIPIRHKQRRNYRRDRSSRATQPRLVAAEREAWEGVVNKPTHSKSDLRAYGVLRKAHLAANPSCAICFAVHGVTHPADRVHHRNGRKHHLLDTSTFVSACKAGEKWVHENQEESRRLGF